MSIGSIHGDFTRTLSREQEAPCWESRDATQSDAARDVQELLDGSVDGNYDAVRAKLSEYMDENKFFRLTEGRFYEVTPGDFKQIQIKIQVKEGTISWYFAGCKHDETTQEYRNLIFRTASLGHLLVPGACAKYYRGTNAMHVRRMHTSEEESKINHNHYRVHDDHVTVDQFRAHLEGFLTAQEAYGIKDKFLNQEEVEALVKEYAEFDVEMDAPYIDGRSLRVAYHEQELSKWTEVDINELEENRELEGVCEFEEVIIPLNQRRVTVDNNDGQLLTLKFNEWTRYIDQLDKDSLDTIAKAGSEGIRSIIAQTRQISGSTLPELTHAFERIGELFNKADNGDYPPLTRSGNSA